MKIIRLARTLLRQNAWFVGALQAALIFACLTLSWLLASDFTLAQSRVFLLSACLLISIRLWFIAGFGLLHGWWRYTGLSDTLDVAKAVICGSAVFAFSPHFLFRANAFPRAVYALEPLLTAGTLIGVRVFSRVLAESMRQDIAGAKNVLLIGAGTGAQMVVRELRHPGSHYSPVGFLDDDLSKSGLRILDVPVLGTVDRLPELVNSYPFDEVLIAVPSATSTEMQRFVEICERTRVPFRTVPALRDVITHRTSLSDFRQVNLEDLLGRDPVDIDLAAVRTAIEGKSIVVTGAAGSIGSELCRQILQHQPMALHCIDHNETAMFYLDRELGRISGTCALRFHVSDFGDRQAMDALFRNCEIDTVFHAAAYKHVPLMEDNVAAAVQNNVFGLQTLLETASTHGCEAFILISSDKAVNPANVMGATKRIGELMIALRPGNSMRSLCVRFGNVLGSNGSLIPVLQEQLQKRQPLTITHPEIKRFFMTIQEAVSLVLQASVIGDPGDTLVLDMGEPLTILDVARTLIRLSGQKEEDIAIQFTGLRPGEKLIEELFYPQEEILETVFPKIKRVRGPARDWDMLALQLEDLEAVLYSGDSEALRSKLQEMLPEYSNATTATTQIVNAISERVA